MGGRLCSWRDITRTYKWGRESLFWRQDQVQMTLATPLEEALIGFCLLWCSHSLHRGGADFAAGGMEVRQQIHGLSKARNSLDMEGGMWHCERSLLVMQTNVQNAGVAGSPEGPLARAVADECTAWCQGVGLERCPAAGDSSEPRIPMTPPHPTAPGPQLASSFPGSLSLSLLPPGIPGKGHGTDCGQDSQTPGFSPLDTSDGIKDSLSGALIYTISNSTSKISQVKWGACNANAASRQVHVHPSRFTQVRLVWKFWTAL